MRKSLAILLVSLMLSPQMAIAARGGNRAADAAYEAARQSYYTLKEDAERRKFRHHWLNVVHKFDAVTKKYPDSPRAADALFTGAELLRDLSRISMLQDDLRAGIERYESLLERFPQSSLSDDAALALAHIYMERLGEPDKARRVLGLALKKLPRGDMYAKLAELEKTLPHAPAEPPRGKRVARAEEKEPQKAPPRDRRKRTAVVADGPKNAEPPAEKKAEAAAVAELEFEELPPSAPPLLEAIARATGEPVSAPAATEPTPTTPEEEDPAQPAVAARRAPPVDAKEARERLRAAVKSGGDEVTLAEQLGLKVRRVVIDAGHGGHDTGAIGKKGTREKDVTLAIAKRVGQILADRGLEVILTRDDDTYVRLEDRTRIANEAKGDLFISIHCNAAESRRIRGIETFTLNVAADRYSIRLAARENAASEKSISDLQFILADLATKANTEESERLAKRVQGSLVSNLSREYRRVKNLGTKQALFYVLLGAKMPAILVETAFLSHPEEEERLASKEYQEHTAQAIADGVQGFLDDRQRLAQVD